MKTLFSRLLLSFILIIALIIVSVLASFYLFYTRSYDEQIIGENSRQAQYVAHSLYSYINTAYKTVEELSFNSDVISLDTQRQTPVFVSAIQRNDYFVTEMSEENDQQPNGCCLGKEFVFVPKVRGYIRTLRVQSNGYEVAAFSFQVKS